MIPSTGLIVFVVVGVVMVVVSFFTEKIPRDELGGLTWQTINDPPLAQSPTDMAIERHVVGDAESGKPGAEKVELIGVKKTESKTSFLIMECT